jgi:hypothetical protein
MMIILYLEHTHMMIPSFSDDSQTIVHHIWQDSVMCVTAGMA